MSYTRLRLAQAGVLLSGLGLLGAGLSLLLTPAWFFAHVGTFGAMNRHYMGDLGAFLIPLGAALLPAARNPAAHRTLIGAAAAGSLLHALNHSYDAVTAHTGSIAWLLDAGPLALSGIWLAWVWLATAAPHAPHTPTPPLSRG